jgi:tetraacyldisaccharide 4'-kinase
VPVVSVGNITLGGTGKTPFTIFVADYFLSSGRKPAIITRGYGRDEDRLLSEEVPDARVYVGQDRVRSALKAVSDGCDIIVMDDGFQHRRLARDLDIVLIDTETILGAGSLFPRGVLREGLSSLKRAGILVISKADRSTAGERAAMVRALSKIASGMPVIESAHEPSFLSDVTGTAYPPQTLCGKKTLLVSGIASPGYFSDMAAGLGAQVVGRMDYGDHHAYSDQDVREIEREGLAKGADIVLVTKKDFVKLRNLDISGFEEKLYVLNIRTGIIEGRERLLAGFNSILSCTRG